jgi:hypothetical protein
MNKKAIAKSLISLAKSMVSVDNTAVLVDIMKKIASAQGSQKAIIEDAKMKTQQIDDELTNLEKQIRSFKIDSFDAETVVAEMKKLGVNWGDMESKAVGIIEATYGKRLPSYDQIKPKWSFVDRR